MISDADSGVEESQDLGTSEVMSNSAMSKIYKSTGNKRHTGFCQKPTDLKPPHSSVRRLSNNKSVLTPSAAGTIRRVGGAGVGSLLVFRLHAALSDDARAVVHLLTNCLADTKSTSSPLDRSPTVLGRTAQVDCRLATTSPPGGYGPQQRWRGQRKVEQTGGECQMMGGDEKAKSSNHPKKTITYTSGEPERPFSASESVQPAMKGSCMTACPPTTSCGQSPTTIDRRTGNVIGGVALTQTTASLPPISRQTDRKPEIHTPVSLTTSLDTNEDDFEELVAAQWWYSFWSCSLATIATICDLIRALLTGPVIVLHKYLFTWADMGVLAIRQPPYAKRLDSQCTAMTEDTGVWADPSSRRTRSVVYRCTLLSLLKLSRIRQVTKASYSEIVLSLLAGGLRAYHQSIGVHHPPDLLAILSTEVPALPDCSIRSLEQAVYSRARHLTSGWRANSNTNESLFPSGHHSQGSHGGNSCVSRELNQSRRSASDHLMECGLLHSNAQHQPTGQSLPPLPANINSLRPGRHIFVDVCLPLNTEGMLPRLWETRQRLLELSRSIEPLCLSWARSLIYTIMPHFLADWLETTFGSSAKASVNVTSVEVVSPFSQSKEVDEAAALNTYQMPANRRLAYMSLLASKSAEARSLRRRLQRRLPRAGQASRPSCPPRQGTSFRAMARHLANANAGLVYVAGSPIIRIDTWMPSARQADLAGTTTCDEHSQQDTTVSPAISVNDSTETAVSSLNTDNWLICRDLSVTFTTYAGQLSLAISADAAMDAMHPNLGLIIQAMHVQLRKMYRLLAGRYVPTAPDRWLHPTPQWDTGGPNRFIQNPNAPVTGKSEQKRGSNTDGDFVTSSANQEHNPLASLPSSQSNTVFNGASESEAFVTVDLTQQVPKVCRIQSKYLPNMKKVFSISSMQSLSKGGAYSVDETAPECYTGIKPTNLSEVRYEQPTEQLQDRLRWVQQQLMETAVNPSQTVNAFTAKTRISSNRVAALRTEFSTLLRELKQRCSLGSLGISPDLQPAFEVSGSESSTHQPGYYTSSTTVTLLSHRVSQEGVRDKPITHGRTDGIQSTMETSGFGVGPVTTDYSGNLKHLMFPASGGDFDEDPDFHIDGCSEEDEEFEFEHPALVECGQPIVGSGHRARPRNVCKVKRRSSSLLQLPTVAITNFDLKPGRRGSLGATTAVTTTSEASAPTGSGILAKIAKLTTTSGSPVIYSPATRSSLTVRLSRR